MKRLLFAVLFMSLNAFADTDIVGGIEVKSVKKEVPFMANLFNGGCGGSVIAPQWVLTAAHCVVGQRRAHLTVRLGSQRSNAGEAITASKVIIHPHHRELPEVNGDSYDYALIKLSHAFTNANTQPIELADRKFDSAGKQEPGTIATVFGWGDLSEDGSSPTVLRKVDVPIVASAVANESKAYNGAINASMIAAGYAQGKKDSCNGDSGGPLVIKDPETGRPVLVGIVSFGEGCARAHKYGIYSKVSTAAHWIKTTMEENE